MESIEKLRKWARDFEWSVVAAIADDIEAEIAERYIPLPLDEDGVPIHVGEICYEGGEPFKVSSIEWNGICWSAWSKPEKRHIAHHVSHVEPRTIEDVLTDFAEEWMDTNDASETLAKYAEEIRGMMEGE